MAALVHDLRLALRALASNRAVTVAAVLCSALGIGLCVSIFSVAYSFLVRPFPFAEPESIVAIVSANPSKGIEDGGTSLLNYLESLQKGSSFSALAAYSEASLTFSGANLEPERVQGGAVSASLFPLLGVKPLLGRSFLRAEDQPGAPGVVLLSYALWVRKFGADPKVVGRWIQVDNVSYQVIGVMPARFEFPIKQQAWVPMSPRLSSRQRGDRDLEVLARLKPGVSLAEAGAEAATFSARAVASYPEIEVGWHWRVLLLRDFFVSPGMRVMSLTMMGAAIFVLLIACANVANLLLVRASERQQEMTLRAALGASPSRIVRQLLTESLVLAIVGGLLGAAFAFGGVRALKAVFPAATTPYWIVFALDLPVLIFAAAIALLTGLLVGLLPALQSAKTDLLSVIQEGGGRGASEGRARRRLRSSLVVGEIALSVVLLVGGALFVRSFFVLQEADSGFVENGLLTLRFFLPGESYKDDAVRMRATQEVLRRVSSLPGVEGTFASSLIPLAGGVRYSSVEIAGQSFPKGQEPLVRWAAISRELFSTLKVPIEQGRGLTDEEAWEGRPVAIVDRIFADRFFPQGAVVGQRFRLPSSNDPQWFTVVGLARPFKVDRLDEEAYPGVFLPYRFSPSLAAGLVIRAKGEPSAVISAVRREIRSVDPGIPVFDVATMNEVRKASIWTYRLVSQMFSIFGVLALILAVIGVYGVLSYSVTRRRREIGTRLSLGAQRSAVLGLVVRQGMALAALGLALGLVGAFFVSRILASFLYGVSASDPLSYTALSFLLLAVAALASYLPARRATLVNPIDALRES